MIFLEKKTLQYDQMTVSKTCSYSSGGVKTTIQGELELHPGFMSHTPRGALEGKCPETGIRADLCALEDENLYVLGKGEEQHPESPSELGAFACFGSSGLRGERGDTSKSPVAQLVERPGPTRSVTGSIPVGGVFRTSESIPETLERIRDPHRDSPADCDFGSLERVFGGDLSCFGEERHESGRFGDEFCGKRCEIGSFDREAPCAKSEKEELCGDRI